MADHVKQTKNKIGDLKRSIQHEEAQRDEWASTIPAMEAEIAGLKSGPEQDEWKKMKADAERSVATFNASIARFQEQLAALEAELPQTPEPAVPKFDPEKHPLLRKAVEKQEPEKAVVFSTGEMCEAQWTDKSWYKAKIQSILGSVSAPKYLVRFIEYDDTMTVDRSAVRPLPSKRKRESEPTGPPQPAVPVTSTPHVISGPASINPNAQTTKNSASNETDEPKQASRVPNKGILKKRATNWKEFQAKAGKKMPKKESMFRTSTEFGSRVGFTGSGKGMTETHKRQRYDHKADADNDEEYNESAPQNRKRF
ncbi:Nn.00g043830.m01.CDS01 [Neocucurbitaria sp. VM-36]